MSTTHPHRGLQTAGTLLGLSALLVLAAAWGWSALTDPLPGGRTDDGCHEVRVAAGEQVRPEQIVVSVLNASGRSGLANQTMRELMGFGFAEGDLGNAPKEYRVPRVQIWTDDPESPAAKLLARYLTGSDGTPANIVERKPPLEGLNVVLGERYKTTKQGPRKLKAKSDAVFCGPPPDAVPPLAAD